MVPPVGIQETHSVVSGSGVDELVYLWKREAVFGTGLIEVGEVHADLPFSRLLFYHHRVGQPLRIVDLLYYACLEELLNFFSHGLCLWAQSGAVFEARAYGWDPLLIYGT